MSQIKCQSCGKNLPSDSIFCMYCGGEIKHFPEEGFKSYDFYNLQFFNDRVFTKKDNKYYFSFENTVWCFDEKDYKAKKLFHESENIDIEGPLSIVDDYIYYKTGYKIYRILKTGENLEMIFDGNQHIKVSSSEMSYFVLDNSVYIIIDNKLIVINPETKKLSELLKLNSNLRAEIMNGYKNELFIQVIENNMERLTYNKDRNPGPYIYNINKNKLENIVDIMGENYKTLLEDYNEILEDYKQDSYLELGKQFIEKYKPTVDLYNQCIYMIKKNSGIIKYDMESNSEEIIISKITNAEVKLIANKIVNMIKSSPYSEHSTKEINNIRSKIMRTQFNYSDFILSYYKPKNLHFDGSNLLIKVKVDTKSYIVKKDLNGEISILGDFANIHYRDYVQMFEDGLYWRDPSETKIMNRHGFNGHFFKIINNSYYKKDLRMD